ncbi:hypothetical protein QUF54_00295 [Candidatus Marithioploca araucensis]|uniref:Uncharacterized protein n=1 Tax=Candidatus Marithioploca araucensis TaxID=70273 RepID=A0ABT7VQ36_9GAMM|nr:hypothetical protein [Candidatus Marithioploca araucensis]
MIIVLIREMVGFAIALPTLRLLKDVNRARVDKRQRLRVVNVIL